MIKIIAQITTPITATKIHLTSEPDNTRLFFVALEMTKNENVNVHGTTSCVQ